jgi:hypothetical protein
MLVYHLPLLIAFATRDVTLNVWGGCMLMPLQHLREDTYGIMRVRLALLYCFGAVVDTVVFASLWCAGVWYCTR